MNQRALSTWSLHEPIFAGRLSALDALGEAARLGFQAVEYNDLFAARPRPPLWLRGAMRLYRLAERFAPFLPRPRAQQLPRRYDPAIVPPLLAAAERAGVRLVSWTLDTDLLAGHDPRQRAYWAQGIAVGRAVGAEVLRITTGGPQATPATRESLRTQQLPKAVAALRELNTQAEQAGLRLAIENHWGLSTDPELLAELIAAVGAPRQQVGVCLDFGNFPRGQELAGIRRLAPLTTHIHVKSYAFGPDGEETRLPYAEILATLREAGATGWAVIEFEGEGDPVAGVRATQALLDRYTG